MGIRIQDKGFIYATQALSAIEDKYMQPMQYELFRNKYYSLIFCADLFHDQSKFMNLVVYSHWLLFIILWFGINFLVKLNDRN